MNKTRSLIYTQLNKEPKQKLEVELGIAQDIAQLISEAEGEFERGENEKKSIKQIAADAISSYKQGRVKANQALKAYEKFEKSAKDLGLDVPAKIKSAAEDAQAIIDAGETEIRNLQQFR